MAVRPRSFNHALKKPENRRLLSAVRAAGRRPMTGTYWLLLTTEREVFGSRRSQPAGRFYKLLEQTLAQHLPGAPGRPEEIAPAD